MSRTKSDDDGENEQYGQSGGEIPIEIVPEMPLFMEEASFMEVILFPNPSSGEFYIQAKLSHPSPIVVRLFTITGQSVASFVIPQQSEEMLHRSNFSNLPSGVYLLQLLTDHDMKTLRLDSTFFMLIFSTAATSLIPKPRTNISNTFCINSG